MSAINFPLTTTSLFVNTINTNKIIYLPAASTVNAGRLFYIKDICGNAAKSSIYISSTGMDRIENYFRPSTLYAVMSTNYGSVLMAPDGALNWYFLQHYYKNAVSSLGATVVLNGTVIATGGTITTNGIYKIHTFTASGSFTLTSPGSIAAQVLVVGGGGGGGGYYNGGGGGAGGAVYNSAFTITSGSYTVTIGNGGSGQSGYASAGTSGSSSTFSTLTGNGGGAGGSDNNVNGVSGGCGGGMGPLGATAPGSGTQGYAGGYGTNGANMGNLGGTYGSGYGGGGGGGMGSVGSNALTSAGPGWGGTGATYSVGGTNYVVCGGGGAGTADTDNTNFGLGGSSIGGVGGLNAVRGAGNGAANTGSGGGGYGRNGAGSAGGTGGSGIVIIAYTTSSVAFTPASITGLKLWLDAADATTITLSAGNMTQWTDKSGNANTMTQYGGYSNVTVSSAYQNGRNVLNFSGGGIYRTPASSAIYPQDVYVIVALKDLTTAVDVLGMGATSTDNFNSLTFSEHTASRWHNGSSFFNRTPNCVSPTNETLTSFVLIQWSIADSNYLLRRNGTQLVQTASYTFTLTSGSVFQLGLRYPNYTSGSPSNPFKGYIGEILAFNTQLGTTDRQTVEGYLAWRWGLQASLPTGHPYLSAAPTGVTFTPTNIAGLSLWLDGADSTTITTVTGVSQWNDKSGNAYNLTQSTTSLQPTRTGNYLNFQSNYYLNIPTSAINNASAYSIFFVFNPIASTNWILQKQYDGTGSYDMISMTKYWISNVGTTAYLYWTAWANNGQFANSGTALSLSTVQLIEITYDGTTLTIYRNGTVLTTSAATYTIPNATSVTNCTLGAWIVSGSVQDSGTTNFQLGEFAHYNAFLSTTNRQQVEGYLAAKWGLQSSLPTGHPYKSSVPTSAIGTPIATGLRYQFDAAKNLPTTSGWTDANGYGNLTFYNSPTVTTGNVNYVSFNGTTQYGASVDMTGLTAFTITMWIRTTSTTDNATQYQKPNIIGQSSMGDSSQDFIVTIGAGYAGVYSGIGSTDAYNQAQGGTSTANYIANNAWHEITVTSSYTNGTRLYVDGTQFGSALTASKTTQSGQNWYIGAANWMGGGANWWAALDLSVLLLYTRELSSTEVIANYNSYRSRFGR